MAIGIALLVYLGTSGAIQWSRLAGLLQNWPLSLAALLILIADVAVISWRLKVLLEPAGFHLTLPASFRLSQIGIFFNSCLPGSTGGDLIKIYYATEGNKGRRLEVATIILFDRAVGMFGFMVLPLLLAPFFPELTAASRGIRFLLWTATVVALAMVAGTLLAWSVRLRNSAAVKWILTRVPLSKFIERLYDAIHSFRLHKLTVLNAVLLSLLAHLLAGSVAMLAALAMFPQQFAWKMSVVIPLGFTANALPFTPGGLGVGEAAFEKLFSMAGIQGGAEALLGWRMLTFVMSLLGLAFYLQGRQRFIHDMEVMQEASETP
jgi:hypothetical protein